MSILSSHLCFPATAERWVSPDAPAAQSQRHNVRECRHPPAWSECDWCRGRRDDPDPARPERSTQGNNPRKHPRKLCSIIEWTTRYFSTYVLADRLIMKSSDLWMDECVSVVNDSPGCHTDDDDLSLHQTAAECVISHGHAHVLHHTGVCPSCQDPRTCHTDSTCVMHLKKHVNTKHQKLDSAALVTVAHTCSNSLMFSQGHGKPEKLGV